VTDVDRSVQKSNIWPQLAGLRFFFAMWVLFDHTYNFGPADRAIPVLTKSGLMAVMCFFVISGFSIHHSIKNKPDGYGRRRFWRIFPLNALAVFIGWFAWSVMGLSGGYGTPPFPVTTLDFIGCLLLLQVFFPVMVPFFFPAWSLSIEALYYFCAPVFRRLKGDAVLATLMITSCALFVMWPFIRDEYIAADRSYGFAALGMLWAWLAGWVAYDRPGNRIWCAALNAGGLISLWTHAKYFGIVDYGSAITNVLAWTGTLCIVFYRLGTVWSDRSATIINYLGEISFPLYLLHYPVLFALTSSVFKVHPEWNYGIVQVAIALASAVLAYHFVDRPLRSGIRRTGRRQPDHLSEYRART
jgi:peptidoglycan/LPS O-acetylase OafA/YrhL